MKLNTMIRKLKKMRAEFGNLEIHMAEEPVEGKGRFLSDKIRPSPALCRSEEDGKPRPVCALFFRD